MTARYYIMLGAPGAGKGTQAKQISEELGLPHISSGDLFRHHLGEGTELGVLAKKFMDSGELVPDDVTIGMVQERLEQDDCSEGAILDGFPRTPAQAEAIELLADQLGGKVAKALYLDVNKALLVERLSGRWVCPDGHVYHTVYHPPKKPGICDIDGLELYQRDDDKKETVEHRITVYLEQTAPLIAYYRERGTLATVDGDQDIEQVQQSLLQEIG
ncbi:MAG: adenylate kinase [Anaerolineales bacterium]|nr:adenylate kinase [Anaerolineales bacterium]